MELYLIRHGIAAERGTYDHDEERPLTDKGRERTKKVAKRLLDVGVTFDVILSSPLVRAYQTAEILQSGGLSSKMKEFPALAPNGNIQEAVSWLDNWRSQSPSSCIAFVGHSPDLGNWAETFIWGKAQEKLVVKKAGVIGLKLPTSGSFIGESELFLLTSPKWLLAIGK